MSSQNLNIVSGVAKLNPKYIGPFPITKIINKVAVQLQLPAHFKVQNVFHVDRLKRAKDSIQFPDRPVLEKPPPVIQADKDQDSEWEIEKIVERRRKRNRVEYLVKWKGYDSYDNQWLPVSQLSNARKLIQEFDKLNGIELLLPHDKQHVYKAESHHQMNLNVNLSAATVNPWSRVGKSIQC